MWWIGEGEGQGGVETMNEPSGPLYRLQLTVARDVMVYHKETAQLTPNQTILRFWLWLFPF